MFNQSIRMTSVTYEMTAAPLFPDAFSNYLLAFYSPIGSTYYDSSNNTVTAYCPDGEPTDVDVQNMYDLVDAYRDPPYYLSYDQTQINSCPSDWTSTSALQSIGTNQIPTYAQQPQTQYGSLGGVLDTIVWLVEFDMGGPAGDISQNIPFNLVDITTAERIVLGTVNVNTASLFSDSYSNSIAPNRYLKKVKFDELAIHNLNSEGVWQLELEPIDSLRVRAVSQELRWYSIYFDPNIQDHPLLPNNISSFDMYKTPLLDSAKLPVVVDIIPPSWSSVTGPSDPKSSSTECPDQVSDPSDPVSSDPQATSDPVSDPNPSEPVSSDPVSSEPSNPDPSEPVSSAE